MNWKFYRPYRDKIVDKKNEILSKIFDKKKKEINIDVSKINKLLFLRVDGKIGDYIVSSFAFREIKKCYPHIQIDVIADRGLEGILKLNKYIDNYYLFNRKKNNEWKKMAKKLKGNNYDVLLDATEGLKYRQIYFLNKINAKINVGYNKDDYQIFNKKVKISNSIKMVEIYQKMLECVNIKIDNTEYDVPVSDESEKEVNQFLKENNVKEEDKIIALNFFGASKLRKISSDNGIIIIKKLKERYKNVKIILLDSPQNRKEIYDVLHNCNNKDVLFFEKSKTILDSISIIKRSNLVVSLDTSILHIAEGLNKRIIAFYGPKTNKNKWRVREEGNILIDYDGITINQINFENELQREKLIYDL